ncbi:hypothetical protein MNBD_ALPHA07-605 [hydrothermal vent metagenome]|uniref:Uncharacterized protein n=1 Tax=hydrothermal vent metagenome TaxID=652676 RepID=A0A3B0REC6_9ZZZZ
MSKILITSALTATVFLSACLNKESFETEPVKVSTKQGVVICQLYTHEKVLWDRAISAPAGMSIETADKICFEEGKRVKAGV